MSRTSTQTRTPRTDSVVVPPHALLFGLVACGIAAVRFFILAGHGAPATVDSGNWIAFGHSLFGERIRSTSLIYPPVVPVGLTITVGILGAKIGVALFGAMASVVPGIVLYLLIRRRISSWAAVALGCTAVAAGSIGEATAWGGFPQLLGLGGMLIALSTADRWALTGRPRDALTSGGVCLFVAMTSDIVFAATLFSLALLLGIRLTIARCPGMTPRALARTWPLLLVPLAPAVPLYVVLLNAVRQSLDRSDGVARLALHDIPGRVEFLYRDLPVPWRVAVVFALITPLLLARRRHETLWVLSTTLIVVSLAAAAVLHQDRFLYLLPIGVLLALALWSDEIRVTRRTIAGVALTVFATAQVVTGLHAFSQQRTYYGVLDPGLTRAIGWLSDHTPDHSLVAVPSLRTAPLGWWVEGLGHRPTLLASPLRWLNFADERRRAQFANRIFTVDFPSDATMSVARGAGASYVVIPVNSDSIDPRLLDPYLETHAHEIVFRDATTVILRP